jgi:hypothetical protein
VATGKLRPQLLYRNCVVPRLLLLSSTCSFAISFGIGQNEDAGDQRWGWNL